MSKDKKSDKQAEEQKKTKALFKQTCKEETKAIANYLKDTRKFLGLTQEEMARKVEVSRSYICALEHGECTVPAYIIKKYCEISGLSANAFLRTNTNEDYHEVRTESGRKILEELPFMSKEDADDVLAFYEMLKKRHKEA